MSVYLKYLSLCSFLILLSSFTINKITHPKHNPNKRTKEIKFPANYYPALISNHLNDCFESINSPDRLDHHRRGKYSKHLRNLKMKVNGLNTGLNNDTETQIIKYFRIKVHAELDDSNADESTYEEINILNPKIDFQKTLFYKSQPIRRLKDGQIDQMTEIVHVSNIKLSDDQCELNIKNYDIYQDSFYVAHYENSSWQEVKILLSYHLITKQDDSQVIYRSFIEPKINDRLAYDQEPFQINGINDTIVVYKWANSDGYPHVVISGDSNDHYKPQGCGN